MRCARLGGTGTVSWAIYSANNSLASIEENLQHFYKLSRIIGWTMTVLMDEDLNAIIKYKPKIICCKKLKTLQIYIIETLVTLKNFY